MSLEDDGARPGIGGRPERHGADPLVGDDLSVWASVVQVLGQDGTVAGAGFLAGQNTAFTCAHVVHGAGQGPGAEVVVVFPNLPGAPRASAWVAAEGWRAPDAEDIAVLQLERVPAGVRPVPLGAAGGCREHRVRTFGFPAGAPGGGRFGDGTAGDLLAGDAGVGRLLQLSQANDLTAGFSGGPVVDQLTGLVIGMVTSISLPDSYLKGLGIAYATPAEVLREARPELAEHQVCPYLGLESFTAQHANWFHGREEAVERFLAALDQHRQVLMLLGASGSGKSSLVKAGVLPALAEGAIPGSDRWLPLLARPGQDLIAELEHAGLPGVASDGLVAAVRHRLAEPGYDRLLLVIDQFEELLTQPAPTAEGSSDGHVCDKRLNAAEQLVELIESHAAVTVVLVMRDDFYAPLNTLAPGLMNAAVPGLLNIPATLTVPELKAIITRPADAVGLHIEPGLTDRIISDILQVGSAARQAPVTLLPPLELALRQLWLRRHVGDGRLTHTAYEKIGQVTGAMTAWCNRALNDMPRHQHPTARRILTALVCPADEASGIPATRQPHSLTDLRALAIDTDLPFPTANTVFDQALATLTQYRIITTSTPARPGTSSGEQGQPTAELIHDALIRDWNDLRNWVAQDRQFQLWLHRAGEQQQRHAQSGHSGDLLDGTLLTEGEEWAQKRSLPEAITVILKESRRYQKAEERRAKRNNRFLAGMLALALAAVGIALSQRNTAIRAEHEAVTTQHAAQSRQLANESTSLAGSNPDLASLLAVKAWNTSHTTEAAAALYTAPGPELRDLLATYSEPVQSVAFSPDGRTLAVGSSGTNGNGSVQLWNMATSKPLRPFKGSTGAADSVAFSPDSKILATDNRNGDGAVRLWDVSTGKPVRTFKSSTGFAESVAFSPDGKIIAIGIFVDFNRSVVRLWDVSTGKPLRTLKGFSRGDDPVAFSPDGSVIATGSSDNGVRLWDVATGKPLQTFKNHTQEVDAVAFSPDGKYLAATSYDGAGRGVVRLWDVATGKPLRTLKSSAQLVESVAFSPDGKSLATGSSDHTAQLWDVTTGKLMQTFKNHTKEVNSVAFSPDGGTLATGSDDGTVRLWNVATGKPRYRHTDHVGSVDYSPDGKILVIGSSDHTAQLWDVATGKPLRTLKGYIGNVGSAVFSLDDKTLATTGSNDDTVRLWDVATGTQLYTLKTSANLVESVAYSPDGKILAAGSIIGAGDGTVRLWDVVTGKALRTFKRHTDAVYSVAFSSDGKILATGGDDDNGDGAVRLWDVATGKPLRTLKGYTGNVASVVFSLGGKTLATTSANDDSSDDTVRLWDVATGTQLKSFNGSTGPVLSVAFSPDGKTLATGSGDDHGTVQLWDVASGTMRTIFESDSAGVNSVAFGPDGRTLATGSSDDHDRGTVQLWDVHLPNTHEIADSICKALHRDSTQNEQSQYLRGQDLDPVCSHQSAH